ncbi:MAG: endolytic transglycosylase MltG [Pseudomonadota bacterium]
MKKVLALFFIVIGLGVGAKVALHMYLAQPTGLQKNALFWVKKGSSFNGVAQQLQKRGVVANASLFAKIGRFYGYDKKLKFGEYQMTSEMTYDDVYKKITSGDSFRYSVTFVEGDHIYDYARILEKKGLCKKKDFLALVKNTGFIKKILGERQKTLEGYLFPDTYSFSKVDGAKKMIKTMVSRFFTKTKSLGFSNSKLSRHQAVTLASIIEKETGAAFERPLISSVFHNRMKKKMRLQTDPTIIYGILDKTGREITNIRKKDIRAPTAYNTYVIKGLPPGPIANPGFESLKAALNPKKSDFLYFVSQNDGTHVFSKTYKAHQGAVRKYQLNPKRRQRKKSKKR